MGNKALGALLGVGLLVLGCSESADRTKQQSEVKDRPAQTDAEKQAEFARKKDAYRTALAERLAELDLQAQEWKAKTDKAVGDAKKRMQDELDQLNQQRRELDKKVETLKETTISAWDEFSGSLDRAAVDLRSAFEKARDKFK